MFEDMRTEKIPVSQSDFNSYGEIEKKHDIVFKPKNNISESVFRAFGWLDGIKGLIHEYELITIVAFLILLLLDCDDNIELLIAAAIMLYPFLK